MAHRGAIFAVVVAALLVPAMGQGRGSGPPAAATTTASDEDEFELVEKIDENGKKLRNNLKMKKFLRVFVNHHHVH